MYDTALHGQRRQRRHDILDRMITLVEDTSLKDWLPFQGREDRLTFGSRFANIIGILLHLAVD